MWIEGMKVECVIEGEISAKTIHCQSLLFNFHFFLSHIKSAL
jgi:hypothetical protein